jgi:hypothetical protein
MTPVATHWVVTTHAIERFVERFGGPEETAVLRIKSLIEDAHPPTDAEWRSFTKRRSRHKRRSDFRVLGSIVFVVDQAAWGNRAWVVVTVYRSQELQG